MRKTLRDYLAETISAGNFAVSVASPASVLSRGSGERPSEDPKVKRTSSRKRPKKGRRKKT